MRKDKKVKVEDIQATDNLQIDDIQVNEDAVIIQKPKAGEVLKKFFRSLFVSENGNEAKFLTLYKKEGTKSILSSLLCILGGIFIGWLVLLIIALATEDIPTQDAFDGLKILLSGPSTRKTEALRLKSFGNMIFETAPLIMTGLSVAIAFKTGLFNIGAPGQYLMGTMGALLVALGIPTTESTAIGVWLLAIIVGMLFGMIWGLIPGLFKAFLGVNEVIVCIMSNWLAANIVSWVFHSLSDDSRFINPMSLAKTVKTAVNGVATPTWGLEELYPRSNIDIGIFIAIAIAIALFIFMNKTTLGYELKACGHNKYSAKYAGMNEKRNIMLSMAIAGGLAAIGATLYYLNGNTEFEWNTYTRLPDEGFNGIPVALLASNNPLGVVFGALFLKYLDTGGYLLSNTTGFNEYVSDFVVALIIYFAGFSKFIKDLLSRRRKSKKAPALTVQTATVGEATEQTVEIMADEIAVDETADITASEDTESIDEVPVEAKQNKVALFFADLSAKIKALFTKKADSTETAENSEEVQIEEKEEENE